jgi:putative ABC transport system ATP-binding protein
MKTILEFDTVSYTWPGGQGLRNVRLTVPAGAFVRIVGPSGSGKSTLLRLISRLEEPSSGVIRFSGTPLGDFSPPLLRRRIGYIQQTPVVIEGSVRQNLQLPYGFAANKELALPTDDELRGWLDRLGLSGIDLENKARSLSVGQRQRLCIIRSLLLRPDLLLMDEPTSALDRESRRIVEEMTETQNREGMTILMVTHFDYAPSMEHMTVTVREGLLEVAG